MSYRPVARRGIPGWAWIIGVVIVGIILTMVIVQKPWQIQELHDAIQPIPEVPAAIGGYGG
jgi:hypothetical protein